MTEQPEPEPQSREDIKAMEDAREKKAKLQAQFNQGKFMFLIGIAMFFFHWMRRGHPSTWVVGPRWNSVWGGDWEELTRREMIRKVHNAQRDLFFVERAHLLAEDPDHADVCRIQAVCEAEIESKLCQGEVECFHMQDMVQERLKEMLAKQKNPQPKLIVEEEDNVVVLRDEV